MFKLKTTKLQLNPQNIEQFLLDFTKMYQEHQDGLQLIVETIFKELIFSKYLTLRICGIICDKLLEKYNIELDKDELISLLPSILEKEKDEIFNKIGELFTFQDIIDASFKKQQGPDQNKNNPNPGP